MITIKEKAERINHWLLQQEVVQEYQRYESLVKANAELQALESTIKQLQKQIVKEKANQQSDVVMTIQEYEKKKQQWEEHPLVVNYLFLKKEVDSLLQHINIRINGELSTQHLTK